MRPVSGALSAAVALSACSAMAAAGKGPSLQDWAEDQDAGFSVLHGSAMVRKVELRVQGAVVPGSASAMVLSRNPELAILALGC